MGARDDSQDSPRRLAPSEPKARAASATAIGRLLWCSGGAAAAMLFVFSFANPLSSSLMLASLGGSTVFLFGLTRAPAAQPRALFGGHLGGALIGIVCYQSLGDASWVYGLAVALTLAFMLATKTVHPPAGANPLIMLHSHAGFWALWQPVGLGVLTLALLAAIWSRLAPGMVRYPVHWLDRSPPHMHWAAGTIRREASEPQRLAARFPQ